LIAWFDAAAGLVDILEGLIPREPSVIHWMEQFLPMDVSESSRLGMYLTGLSLLPIARGPAFHHIVLALALLGLLIWRRRDYVAGSDRPSIRWALIIGLPILIGVIVYGVVGLLRLRAEVIGKNNLRAAVQTTLELIFLQSTDSQIAITPRAANFFIQVSAGGMLSGLIMVLLLLRLVFQRALEPPFCRSMIRAIIDRCGCDPLDEFAVLRDKSYWLSDDRQLFFALEKFCCVLSRSHRAARALAACHPGVPALLCGSGLGARLLPRECGLKSFKVGEDARLSVADFNLKRSKFQNLRTARNKARKEGKVLCWYQPGDGPFNYGLEAQLKLLSDEWLKKKQGTEMTFDLGSFDLERIRKDGVAAIFNAEGKLEAFATWLSYRQGRGRCLDLMRSYPEPKGVMDFLIVESIDHFKGLGVEEVSLGNAPLANAEQDPCLYGREEKAVKFLFERFNRYYGYKSLFEFKKKYQPSWQGRYLGFRPNVILCSLRLR
jgi:phosphatidylglycerol lysyltransferase